MITCRAISEIAQSCIEVEFLDRSNARHKAVVSYKRQVGDFVFYTRAQA